MARKIRGIRGGIVAQIVCASGERAQDLIRRMVQREAQTGDYLRFWTNEFD